MATDRYIRSKVSDLVVTQDKERRNFSGSFHLVGDFLSLITDLDSGHLDLQRTIEDEVKTTLLLDEDEWVTVYVDEECARPVALEGEVLTLKISFTGCSS